MQTVRGITVIVDNVHKLDTALTDLKKVTDETDATYSRFIVNSEASAKRIGSTVSDLVESTAQFARLGYTLSEASKLAETASIYSNVGDISIEEGSTSLISTLKAFNIAASDSIKIVNEFNEVGNNFSISSAGIGNALMRSASSLSSANNTLEESIGLITSANSVVQDPEKVGRFCQVA
jgi:TP901 family phage tail tape measure protein